MTESSERRAAITANPDAFPASATCPLCECPGAQRLFFSKDRVHRIAGLFGIYRCGDCRAFFIQPWLSDEELAPFYPERYSRYRHSRSLDRMTYTGVRRFVLENHYGYPLTNGGTSSALKKAAAFLLSFVMAKGVIPYRGAGKFLDVGCGGGSYLYRLKQMGWIVYGVEPSESGVKQARSLGLDVRRGNLPDAHFPDAFFDVVRLNNVLEHLVDPHATFHEINRILKSDGFVYITVPNTRSLVFWLFGEDWYGLDTPRHVISYCPQALKTLCDATDFEIAEMNFAAGPFNFVRSMSYFFEEKGKNWPRAIGKIDWVKSKAIRRALKPLFFFVDGLGYGDFLHATLRKRKSPIIARGEIFKIAHKAQRALKPAVERNK